METVWLAWAIAALALSTAGDAVPGVSHLCQTREFACLSRSVAAPIAAQFFTPPSRPAAGALPSRQMLTVPDMGQFQETAVDCGPHAAARVLAGLGLGQGGDLYRRLQAARQAGLGQDALAVQLGTTPDFLARLVGQVTGGRAIAHVERDVDFATLRRRLVAGDPVLALVRTGTVQSGVTASLQFVVPELHWIVVTGYDEALQQVTFRDTTSNALGTVAYGDFLDRAVEAKRYTWTWELSDRPLAELLRQTGTTPNTFVWIARNAGLP